MLLYRENASSAGKKEEENGQKMSYCLPFCIYCVLINVSLERVGMCVCVPAVACDFLSCSLQSDSLTNCGYSGCINFLTPEAAVLSPD